MREALKFLQGERGHLLHHKSSLSSALGEQASSFLTADGQRPHGLQLERALLEELPGKVFCRCPPMGSPTPREKTGLQKR